MFYASCVGLDKVLLTVQRYASGPNGHAWQVAPLLRKLADERKSF
jgi:3-hydroxyacyl-CoA dehydrogenase